MDDDTLSRKVVGRVLQGSDQSSYAEWLKDHDYKLSREDAAAHRHFVKDLMEIQKALERFSRQYLGHTGKNHPGHKFTDAEAKLFVEFQRLLTSASVPVSLIKVEDDKPMIIL